MKMTAWLLAAVGLVLLPLTAQASSAAQYFGNWKVAKIAGYSDVSVGEDIAKKGLGTTAVISATSIMLPDFPCDGANVTIDTVNVDTLLKEDWNTRRGDFDIGPYKLGKMAKHIKSSCTDGLVLDKDHLLMPDAGILYIIERDK